MTAPMYDVAQVSKRAKPPKMGPHLKSALWVQEIVRHHNLSQEKFAELVDMSRGGLAKIFYGQQRPRFDSLEKLKAVAPPFLKDFDQWERGDRPGMSDPDRNVVAEHTTGDRYVTNTREAAVLADELDGISDASTRRRALAAALNAVRDVLQNPSTPGADKKAGPRSAHS